MRDKASYCKNKEPRVRLADKPTCQVFLSPYPPNLNLTEYFWKYPRQKIISTTWQRTRD